MPKRRFLSQDEIELLLSASKETRTGERNYCLLLMMYSHGYRVSEALSLTFGDIDFNSGHIYIRRSKNGFSTIHPLLGKEREALMMWLKIRQHCADASHSQYIFISRRGQPLSRKQAYNIVKDAGIAAHISLATYPHMLRHACGYALADRGVNTRLIQDYLGHRNIRHTVHYTASNAERFTNMWDEGRVENRETVCHHACNTTHRALVLPDDADTSQVNDRDRPASVRCNVMQPDRLSVSNGISPGQQRSHNI